MAKNKMVWLPVAIGSSSEPRLGVGVTLCDPGQQPITLCYSEAPPYMGAHQEEGEGRVGFVVYRKNAGMEKYEV